MVTGGLTGLYFMNVALQRDHRRKGSGKLEFVVGVNRQWMTHNTQAPTSSPAVAHAWHGRLKLITTPCFTECLKDTYGPLTIILIKFICLALIKTNEEKTWHSVSLERSPVQSRLYQNGRWEEKVQALTVNAIYCYLPLYNAINKC